MNAISTGTRTASAPTTYSPISVGPDGRPTEQTKAMQDLYAKADAKREAKSHGVCASLLRCFACRS